VRRLRDRRPLRGHPVSRPRVLRCAACARRIRPHHPHIGIEDLATGEEFSYHARCRERLVLETAARMERGKAYAMHHYHSALCPDEAPGFGCSGGCFDTPMAAAN
jgi:hypothetical protein